MELPDVHAWDPQPQSLEGHLLKVPRVQWWRDWSGWSGFNCGPLFEDPK